MKSACLAVILLIVAPAIALAQPARAEAPAAVLSVDTPLRELIANPRTRAVIQKRMPGLVEKLEGDPEADQVLGGGTLREGLADPHVRGMTPEILAKIQAELLAAQASR